VVLYDIVAANIEVARLVLGPIGRLRPAFVEVPLAVSNPHVATILGSIVSLTPGTVSVDVDLSAQILHIHALDVADPARLARAIKDRYERPLQEIFGC
jgi:multicomponent K+:H+ antiporter subunit E